MIRYHGALPDYLKAPVRRFLGVLSIAIALTVCVPARGAGQLAIGPDDLLLDRFGEYLESLRTQAGIPGLAAALVGVDDTLWERGFGRQNLERALVTRTDTPFHVDGLTQIFTSAFVLRCVEHGQLSLDDRIGQFISNSADADATIRQVLSHTSGASTGLVFAYRPERLSPMTQAVRACNEGSYRKTLSNGFETFAMKDSVPGPDVISLTPPAEGIPSAAQVARYTGVLGRLATPYAVDSSGRASPTQYTVTTLTPAAGVISTVDDIAQFMLALRKGLLIRPETLAQAWRAPIGSAGQPLPHALGWFVQNYNGETIVWQFGVSTNASSSLLITLPGRGVTLILLANSDGLVRPFALSAGDLTISPFGRLFLGLFVR